MNSLFFSLSLVSLLSSALEPSDDARRALRRLVHLDVFGRSSDFLRLSDKLFYWAFRGALTSCFRRVRGGEDASCLRPTSTFHQLVSLVVLYFACSPCYGGAVHFSRPEASMSPRCLPGLSNRCHWPFCSCLRSAPLLHDESFTHRRSPRPLLSTPYGPHSVSVSPSTHSCPESFPLSVAFSVCCTISPTYFQGFRLWFNYSCWKYL